MFIGTIDNINNKSGEYHPVLKEVLEYLKDKPITVPHNTLPVETSPTKKKKKRK